MTAALSFAGEPAEISSCGQVLQGDGKLIADLDCTPDAAAVLLDGKGTLDLNGFEIRGNGVFCNSRCTIVGPGSITATGTNSCVAGEKSVTVDGVDLSDCWYGVFAQQSATVRNSTIGTTAEGVFAWRSVEIVHSSVTDSSRAVRGRRVDLDTVVLSGNRGEGVDASGKATLVATAVENNCIDSAYSSFCTDIDSRRRPVLDDISTCSHSSQMGESTTWGVCSGD